MIYIVKFLYQTFVLPPGSFIVLLLAYTLMLYRRRERIPAVLPVLVCILYIFSLPLASDNLVRSLEIKYLPPFQPRGDVIVMLGGGATQDTPNLNGRGHLSSHAANRLLTSAQLYVRLKVPIIISGGQVYNSSGSEAEIARHILMGLGVPEDMIIIESRSQNTTQNAKYTKEILEAHRFKAPILVTSAFHMERSVRQFRKVNLAVTPYPSDYLVNVGYKFHARDLIPSAEALNKINLSLKEYIGILFSRLY